VVVRLLLGDDPQQTPIAEKASSAGALPVLSFDRRFSASEALEPLSQT